MILLHSRSGHQRDEQEVRNFIRVLCIVFMIKMDVNPKPTLFRWNLTASCFFFFINKYIPYLFIFVTKNAFLVSYTLYRVKRQLWLKHLKSLTSTGFLLRMKKFSALIIMKRMNLWHRIFSISSACSSSK